MTLRTFIVEDDEHARSAVTRMLDHGLDFEIVGHSKTESEAVLWLLSNPRAWDLVLVDLLLARGNGLRVLAACRVRGATQKMVVLTAHATKEMGRRCLDLGANAVFDKATPISALLAYCAHQLEHKKASSERPIETI